MEEKVARFKARKQVRISIAKIVILQFLRMIIQEWLSHLKSQKSESIVQSREYPTLTFKKKVKKM